MFSLLECNAFSEEPTASILRAHIDIYIWEDCNLDTNCHEDLKYHMYNLIAGCGREAVI
jgi:hypothetical protein